ncbi:MAG: hypothetical protein KIT09_33445, partial [Bryobacteraceae bacterium]|nr:hypothetical protein [Bryobacteraceae bacterium]
MPTPSPLRGAAAVVRIGLCLVAGNLLAPLGAAQCSNPFVVPNQTLTSGTHNFPDNNAVKANSVVISGSASVTFVAGNCIQLSPGFHATAGSAATTFRAWLQNPPTADSASPSSGSGLTQAFTWKASSSLSYSNLAEMYALFNTAVSYPNACYLRYNRASNRLYLRNNTDTSWLGNFAPGTSGTASNSQCSISGTGASASGAGNQLTLTVPVTFQASFSGTKNDYLFAQDNAGLTSGWQQKGTWTVGAGSNPKTTIKTNPANLQFKVDGVVYNAQTDFFWTPGSLHTIAVATFQGTGSTRNVYSQWSDGRSARHQITASSSDITYTATFTPRTVTATMQGPTYLQMNLSWMPFDVYDDDHTASQHGFSNSCPAGSKIRSCFKTILADLRRQGISGVRIIFGLCGGGRSTPLSGCGGPWQNVTGPNGTWTANVTNFLNDVSDADIENITLSPAHPADIIGAVPKLQTTTPMGSGPDKHCADTQDIVYFDATSPFGRKEVRNTKGQIVGYYPVGQGQTLAAYNCAPINPFFVGWQHQYDVINAALYAAAHTPSTPSGKSFNVFELDFEQELNILAFPALARFIYDNAQPDSALPVESYADVGKALRGLMTANGFDPLRVTWSAPWDGVAQAEGYPIAEFECANVYADNARNMGLDQIEAAIADSFIGEPSNPNPSWGKETGFLYCGGTTVGMFHDLPVPASGPQPGIIDLHVRPEIENADLDSENVQGEAKVDFNAIRHHLYLPHVRSDAIVVLG